MPFRQLALDRRMDSHAIREENATLRTYITQCEEKMRLLAEALETRNRQIHQWSDRYEEMRAQLVKEQEALSIQSQQGSAKDEEISRLKEIRQHLMDEQAKLSSQNKNSIDGLRSDLLSQRDHFLKTLNELNQAKEPANEAFRQFEDLLTKRDSKIKSLEESIDAANKQISELNELHEKDKTLIDLSERETEKLQKENEDLLRSLQDAKAGKAEIEEIEKLKRQIDQQTKIVQAKKKKIRAAQKENSQLRELIGQKESIIAQYDENMAIANEKLRKEEEIRQSIISEKDSLLKGRTADRQAAKEAKDRLQNEEQKCKGLEMEVRALKDQIEESRAKIEKSANVRVMGIKNEGQEKNKLRELQLRVKQEMEKRLDAEEKVFDMKEVAENLRKEIAVLREEVADSQGLDTAPLVQLLKDLRVEAISIDKEMDQLMAAIPEVKDLKVIEIPAGICESAAAMVAQAAAVSSQYQIENRELRVLVNRFARTASTYHRVVDVIAKYPILTADDIGIQNERGNWILPVEVEHLQRTIIKLHEILMRGK